MKKILFIVPIIIGLLIAVSSARAELYSNFWRLQKTYGVNSISPSLNSPVWLKTNVYVSSAMLSDQNISLVKNNATNALFTIQNNSLTGGVRFLMKPGQGGNGNASMLWACYRDW